MLNTRDAVFMTCPVVLGAKIENIVLFTVRIKHSIDILAEYIVC